MALEKFAKHPDDRKRYVIDYSEWLDTGETVESVTFEVTPSTGSPVVIDGSAINGDGNEVSFFANAGDDGETYEVLVTIETSGGQTKADEIIFVVRD